MRLVFNKSMKKNKKHVPINYNILTEYRVIDIPNIIYCYSKVKFIFKPIYVCLIMY